MSHIKVRSRLPFAREIFSLSDAAFRLYFTAACYCAEQRLGTFVPREVIRVFFRPSRRNASIAKVVAELERTGAWAKTEDGWLAAEAVRCGTETPWVPVVGQRAWDCSAYPAVMERDRETCRYCGTTDNITVDHVVPRCQGGTDHEANLVACCRSCNSRKGGRTPEQAGMVLRAGPADSGYLNAVGASNGPITSSASKESN